MSDPISRPTPSAKRQILSTPSDVWIELTSPEGFEQWMGEGSTIDVSEGGLLIAVDVESGQPKIGVVTEIDPGRSLRWVWRPLGEPEGPTPPTEVAIELVPLPVDDGHLHTLITVIEQPSMRRVPPLLGSTRPMASLVSLVR